MLQLHKRVALGRIICMQSRLDFQRKYRIYATYDTTYILVNSNYNHTNFVRLWANIKHNLT